MYRKILITGPEDLPKEGGLYFCCNKRLVGGNDAQMYLPEKKQFWLNNVDWYLIESDIIMPSEEEITEQFPIIEITEDILDEDSNQQLLHELRNLCKRIGAKWMKSEIERLND